MIDFFNNRPLQQSTPPLVRGDGGDLVPLFSFLGSADTFELAKASAPVAEAAGASVFAAPALALCAIVAGFGGLAYTLYDALQNEAPQDFKPDLQLPLAATPFLITNPFGDFVKRIHEFQTNAKRNARAAGLRLQIAQRKALGLPCANILVEELAALERRGEAQSRDLKMSLGRVSGFDPKKAFEATQARIKERLKNSFTNAADREKIIKDWVMRHPDANITFADAQKAFLLPLKLTTDESAKFAALRKNHPTYFEELVNAEPVVESAARNLVSPITAEPPATARLPRQFRPRPQ